MIARSEETDLIRPRTIGVLWLACIVTGMVGWGIGTKLIAVNDPAVTAARILQNETLFRVGFVADLASGAVYVGVTALLFYLLSPVSHSSSLLAAAFGLTGIAIGGIAWIGRLTSLVILKTGGGLTAFSPEQLQATALLALRLQLQAFIVGMIFFGVQCMIAGSLIARSAFIPKVLGILLAAGGSIYVISSLIALIDPAMGERLTPLILPVAMIGEGSLTLWLLFKGVDTNRWKLQARAAA
jgi:hypothetical protein